MNNVYINIYPVVYMYVCACIYTYVSPIGSVFWRTLNNTPSIVESYCLHTSSEVIFATRPGPVS